MTGSRLISRRPRGRKLNKMAAAHDQLVNQRTQKEYKTTLASVSW